MQKAGRRLWQAGIANLPQERAEVSNVLDGFWPFRLAHTAPQQRAMVQHAVALPYRPPSVISALSDKLALPPQLMDDVMACARRKETGVSLRYILDFGTQPLNRQMELSARFLHTELPIRLSHRIAELSYGLPPELAQSVHIRRVRRWYADSFVEMRDFPPIKDEHDVKNFTNLLRRAYTRHNAVVPAVAKGVEEWKRGVVMSHGDGADHALDIHSFLDRFFLSRIAIRFLAGNHVALYDHAATPEHARQPDRIGLIHVKCKPFQVVQDAVDDARDICIHTRGDAPNVIVRGSKHLTLPYVPSHLHHMVFELVKNSLRAVAERHDQSNGETPPPDIQVVVATGREDVTIKISDLGGGIPRSAIPRMFSYLYTTAKSPLPDVDPDDEDYQSLPAVLAGYGCGLSLSRMYARYFGGDIQLFSMQGYGTDAFIHLSRLGNTEEPLPGQKGLW